MLSLMLEVYSPKYNISLYLCVCVCIHDITAYDIKMCLYRKTGKWRVQHNCFNVICIIIIYLSIVKKKSN